MRKKQMMDLNIQLKEHNLHFCAKCEKIKPMNEFAALHTRNSVQPWCKICKNASIRLIRAKNRVKNILLKEMLLSKKANKSTNNSIKAFNLALSTIDNIFNSLYIESK